MNYSEIVDLALSYADRTDDEVTSRMDSFLRIAESRANRKLRTFDMSIRATLPMTTDQAYYGVPLDFGGLRDIEVITSGGGRRTLRYMSPEQLNAQANLGAGSTRRVFYTLIAQQIQIFPTQESGTTMEIVYYQKIVPLTSDPDFNENWLSTYNPDCYIYGLMVEISAFVKDKDAAALWDSRFVGSLDEIQTEDADERWSGTPLEVRLG